ncbi:hypothetical protein SAY86_011184 [Trapa natans]|uniref:Myb-like domain-containing protein n=1 Tax=Trapa natans TaxID=22666 RepID=A0AAN7R4X4_TRANT|nr:hypothetical protein SAY86_011184 [Trapa natans]
MGSISFIRQDEDKSDVAGVKRGPWSPDEDQKLVAYIRRYGIWNWTHMPKAARTYMIRMYIYIHVVNLPMLCLGNWSLR